MRWFHIQNLNNKPGKRMGSIWRHGRCWWHFGYAGRKVINLEWHWFSKHCHINFTRGGQYSENDLHIGLATPLLAIWLNTENIFTKLKSKNSRTISIAIFDCAIWWIFWQNDSEYCCNTPKILRGCWHPLDTILGKEKYSKREFDSTNIEIPMPEKTYQGTATFTECTWKRPLWFPNRIIRVNIDVPEGIPIPGKGENDWDCGEDAIYKSSFPARTVHEAIGKIVQSAMHDRIKYGGLNWRPTEKVYNN